MVYIRLTIYMVFCILIFMNIRPESFFAALAHQTRLRCLVLLVTNDELCVCELTHVTEAAQPTISRHLAQLRESGLVSDRREGLWIYYRIHPELPDWVKRVLQQTAGGIGATEPFMHDQEALNKMPNRPGASCCA